jgi:glutamate--cysteine ligase catalytic subunit
VWCEPTLIAQRLCSYLQLISRRASGELISAATWQRRFVQAHADYKGDSIVSHTIAHDLVLAAHELALGKRDAPELYADLRAAPPSRAPSADAAQ